ncbi:hypothetical protein C463_13704 [Halorubrum californiense DSM 19288]|uniref:N-acetyltransferase domain-containing protein n=1 Tax=Halorubrum californiense DSM 19288 TaxID=1227465 RepID=M0E4K5_9EURY|nr:MULTISPECIES: hypothetical protein [Halorubrum]ELZ41304.1 hypothetical protein C463_13704 [Halorubrum californiense DSM 19288]TKX71907.1 hypothetical protein EXE40_06140 [Halorubrum sp. GN11GM_10-3_MGM]
MRVRDAVEADAAALGSMTGRPEGVARDMIHDRSVRIAVTKGVADDDDNTADAADEATPAGRSPDDDTPVDAVGGFVSFDVRDGVVHVTNVEGDATAVGRLFEEPVRFATREGMSVEAVLPTDGTAEAAAEAAGFEAFGSGPRIDGASTTRYRFDPEESG